MLFVFGYRAKKIRQSKLKDLIHKSENHRDLDFCRVTVFFQEIVDRVSAQQKTAEKKRNSRGLDGQRLRGEGNTMVTQAGNAAGCGTR